MSHLIASAIEALQDPSTHIRIGDGLDGVGARFGGDPVGDEADFVFVLAAGFESRVTLGDGDLLIELAEVMACALNDGGTGTVEALAAAAKARAVLDLALRPYERHINRIASTAPAAMRLAS